MLYKVKDIVRTVLEYGDRLFAIVGIDNGKYYTVAMSTKKRYWLEESQIRCKEWTLPDDSPLLLLDDAYDPSAGSYFAQQKAIITEGDVQRRWQLLASLIPGQTVDVVVRKVIHRAIFVQINATKSVKVFRARVQDRAMDLSLSTLYLIAK